MGKRSRKRNDGARRRPEAEPDVVEVPVRSRGRPLDVKARRDEAPAAPWGRAPIGELAIFGGLVMAVLGFVLKSSPLLIVGFVFVALAAVELAVREHFAGYRSHSSLLGAGLGLALGSALRLVGLPPAVGLAAGVAVGVAAFVLLRRHFKSLTGGLAFRA